MSIAKPNPSVGTVLVMFSLAAGGIATQFMPAFTPPGQRQPSSHVTSTQASAPPAQAVAVMSVNTRS